MVLSAIFWDPNPVIFYLPIIHYPILWYSLFFLVGFVGGFYIFKNILMRYLTYSYGKSLSTLSLPLNKQVSYLADKIVIYIILATIIGARLGHILFYEEPSYYLSDPTRIFKIWLGGLASHGAAVAIIIALGIFSKVIKKQGYHLSFLALLDLIAIPTAFAAFWIRLGNFFNQEIIGTITSLPWGVVFGHPMDVLLPYPRHPVQLYEGIFYLAVFFFLFFLSYRSKILLTKGKLIGLFFILIFSFRFLIEFLKLEQSALIHTYLRMGQYLSIPFIVLGIFLFFYSDCFWKKKKIG
jgi:prolipoprotein diacylglyceryl transferase